MSRDARYFIIHNMHYETTIRVYGKNTVAKCLRDNGCKFDDKKVNLIQGENALVFKNRKGWTFIVEECADA